MQPVQTLPLPRPLAGALRCSGTSQQPHNSGKGKNMNLRERLSLKGSRRKVTRKEHGEQALTLLLQNERELL